MGIMAASEVDSVSPAGRDLLEKLTADKLDAEEIGMLPIYLPGCVWNGAAVRAEKIGRRSSTALQVWSG
jgi:hypothetical protein